MAKTSSKARQAKRERLVAKYAALRKELKAKGDYEALQKLPRNANPTRLHSRCSVSGRPRGYMRKFGLSRIAFRDLALDGKIPGVTKASW
jgi:small subunit ribosomal protein S14